MRNTEELIRTVVERIVEAVHPQKIILFGSRARGDDGDESDLDLLVVKDNVHKRETAMLLYERIGPIGVAKDIIVASSADIERHRNTSGYIYKPALHEGRVIYAA